MSGSVRRPTEVATTDPSAPTGRSTQSQRRGHMRLLYALMASNYWIVVILLAILAVFSALSLENFTSLDNLRNVAIGVAPLLLMAVGATFVLITAGVDLSVGSVLVFSGVVSAKVMEGVGGGGSWAVALLGLAVALAAGMAWGLLNGLLITKARLPALIATLGTLGMSLALAQVLTNGLDVREVPLKLDDIGTGRLFGQVPYLVLIAAGVTLAGGCLLAFTRFGLRTYAIGSNPEAALRQGVRVERHLIAVYTLAGATSGLAGFVSLARFGTTTMNGHSIDVLQVISGVVLGGTSLFGGVGMMFGTLIGMLIPAFLQDGFIVIGVEPFWQQFAIGAVLLVAVYLDQWRRRARTQG